MSQMTLLKAVKTKGRQTGGGGHWTAVWEVAIPQNIKLCGLITCSSTPCPSPPILMIF